MISLRFGSFPFYPTKILHELRHPVNQSLLHQGINRLPSGASLACYALMNPPLDVLFANLGFLLDHFNPKASREIDDIFLELLGVFVFVHIVDVYQETIFRALVLQIFAFIWLVLILLLEKVGFQVVKRSIVFVGILEKGQ